ncbi:DUF7019 family protein [Actinomadura hibisca]|uniref:DUF7019 family protein n=1 Tax=Actinomadura hibisca TaxID=68565 RepID=UPI000AE224DF
MRSGGEGRPSRCLYMAPAEPGPGEVGTLAEPGPYVRDVARLRYGVLRNYAAELVVFGGVVDGTRLALIGAPDGLTAASSEAPVESDLDYYALLLMRHAIDGRLGEGMPPPYEVVVTGALEDGVLRLGPLRVEFLARTLFRSEGTLVAAAISVATAGH